MKWTFFFGTLLFLCGTTGCVGYNACAPYYGTCSTGICSPGVFSGGCDPCQSCIPSGMPAQSFNYSYGCGIVGGVGQQAVYAAATPVSWLGQILRGTQYPCQGCGDEIYWGDYGMTPDDFCDPCTYEGRWGGRDCGECGQCVPCQRGLAYRYPSVGTVTNQMLGPAFQDKVANTHAQIPMDYALRGPAVEACYDSCGEETCYMDEFHEGDPVESYTVGPAHGCSDGSCHLASRHTRTVANPKIVRSVPGTVATKNRLAAKQTPERSVQSAPQTLVRKNTPQSSRPRNAASKTAIRQAGALVEDSQDETLVKPVHAVKTMPRTRSYR